MVPCQLLKFEQSPEGKRSAESEKLGAGRAVFNRNLKVFVSTWCHKRQQ